MHVLQCVMFPSLSRSYARIAEEQGNNDEPDANVQNDAYRGISFDQWARLAVRVRIVIALYCPCH